MTKKKIEAEINDLRDSLIIEVVKEERNKILNQANKKQFWTALIRAEFGQARGSIRFNFYKRFKFYQT